LSMKMCAGEAAFASRGEEANINKDVPTTIMTSNSALYRKQGTYSPKRGLGSLY
jgi:hypothetical protein